MNFWKRIFISFILIFISLVALQLIRPLEIPEATAGYFILITGSAVSLVVGISIVLISLVQFLPKKAEEKKKEEDRTIEELFTYELLHSLSADKAHELVEKYKYRSAIAKTLSNPDIDDVALAKKLLDSFSQRKVRRTAEYLFNSGKGYQALGAIILHLIEHHKIPPYEANVLKRELKHLMPKRDIIGLYEKVK